MVLFSHLKAIRNKTCGIYPWKRKTEKTKNHEIYSGQLKYKEENNMFATFATKVAVSVIGMCCKSVRNLQKCANRKKSYIEAHRYSNHNGTFA